MHFDRAVGTATLLVAISAGLTGCSSAVEADNAFCTRFERAWNDYVGTRAPSTATLDDEYDAHELLIKDWDSLLENGIDTITVDLVNVAERNLDRARFDGSATTRATSSVYFWNGMDGVAEKCSAADSPVEFVGRSMDLARSDRATR